MNHNDLDEAKQLVFERTGIFPNFDSVQGLVAALLDCTDGMLHVIEHLRQRIEELESTTNRSRR